MRPLRVRKKERRKRGQYPVRTLEHVIRFVKKKKQKHTHKQNIKPWKIEGEVVVLERKEFKYKIHTRDSFKNIVTSLSLDYLDSP